MADNLKNRGQMRVRETFTWTDNEVELLLNIVLNYKTSKLVVVYSPVIVAHAHCSAMSSSAKEMSGFPVSTKPASEAVKFVSTLGAGFENVRIQNPFRVV